MKEMVGGCCVCSDDRGWPENPLVYCDGQGCTVAVHQACYGIVTVPSGNWYCRKCESPERTPRAGAKQQYCELCPSKDGAIKRTDNNGWAHVVCALYIPEVRFGNVTTMEPILLQHIPTERFNKVCYICEEGGKGVRATVGACMQCNKAGCKQTFHVTCAQTLGLLCEEAGNYLDNVKYCGYCQHHYSKLKKGANLKTVPPYRPVSADSSPSPDKDNGEVWQKPQGKRKLSTSGKSSSSTPLGGKSVSGGKSSGSSSPASTAEVSSLPTTQESAPTVATTTASSTPGNESSAHQETTSVNGKFTTSNFVESVVTPTASVFGDSGKSSKKRKSQAKDESSNQPQTIVSPASAASEEKRAKLVESVSAPVKTDSSTPSVVVKVPTSAPSTSPCTTIPSTKPTITTPPIAATSSIVVSVPLAVASLPSNPVTTSSATLTTTPPADEVPAKRGRSQSSDKPDKGRSGKQKRGGSSGVGGASKRGGRNVTPTLRSSPTLPTPTPVTHSTPTPVVMPVSQSIKDSPPSSPDSKQKTKKHSRDEKDKLFQNVNGVNAPHMLGNQLNPASTMAQKMSDTLSQEMEAHSIFSSEPNLSTQPGQLVGPQLHSRVIASVRGSGAGTPQSSATSQSSGTPPAPGWGANNASTPQTLDQLLERQWEQGSQFLMEQAQHFDIASLLTCLHQLRAENLRLEEHVNSLLQRRDHLLAVNARLAIPLVPPTTTPPVNNIHPAVSGANTGPRLNNSYPPGMENGPTSPGQVYHPQQNPISSRHQSPGSTSQPYVCTAPGVVVRTTNVTSAPDSRRSSSQSGSSHPQTSYPPSMYSVQPQQSQIVMRREVDLHHQNISKPS